MDNKPENTNRPNLNKNFKKPSRNHRQNPKQSNNGNWLFWVAMGFIFLIYADRFNYHIHLVYFLPR